MKRDAGAGRQAPPGGDREEILRRESWRLGETIESSMARSPDRARRLGELLRLPPGPEAARMAALTIIHAISSTPPPCPENPGSILRRWEQILDPESPERPALTVPLARDLMATLTETRNRRLALRAMEAAEACRGATGAGTVLQDTVPDRKKMAAYYTRPESATLMAHLAVPVDRDWKDPETAGRYRMADYSCGGGALLEAAARRVRDLHREAGGDPREIHEAMMEESVTAMDILPASAALAIASVDALEPFPTGAGGKTRAATIPYGPTRARDGGRGRPSVGLGAIDILDPDRMKSSGVQPVGRENSPGPDLRAGTQDLVVMNAPFTRSDILTRGVQRDAWTGEQREIAERRMKRVRRVARCGNTDSAALIFARLAHRMVKPGGTIALLLPSTAFSGGGTKERGWPSLRRTMARKYRDIRVISVTAFREADSTFSHDTLISETMLIARRRRTGEPPSRVPEATFVNLREQLKDTGKALEAAREIQEALRLLGNQPLGRPIQLETIGESAGSVTRTPIPLDGGPWTHNRVLSPELAIHAQELRSGATLRRAGRRGTIITRLGDISRTKALGAWTPAWKSRKARATPVLLNHDCSSQRELETGPDAAMNASPKTLTGRLHVNSNFRYNSQSTAACMTPAASAGGKFWPTVRLENEALEKAMAVWLNTTPGLIAHWSSANRTQHGLGYLSSRDLKEMPVLDVTRLSGKTLARMEELFEEAREVPMLPANEAWRDQARRELERRAMDILGISPAVASEFTRMCRLWCLEPTVAGRKGGAKHRQQSMQRLREMAGV